MRLLDKGRMVFNLANCGMLPEAYKTFKQLSRAAARHHPRHWADRLG